VVLLIAIRALIAKLIKVVLLWISLVAPRLSALILIGIVGVGMLGIVIVLMGILLLPSPHLVVLQFCFFVGEYLICLVDLLEVFLFALIEIGVVFFSQYFKA
jgi:hypothetical protein